MECKQAVDLDKPSWLEVSLETQEELRDSTHKNCLERKICHIYHGEVFCFCQGQVGSKPTFSIKYQNPDYPDFISAIDWDYIDEKGVWSRSLGLSDGILACEYTPPIPGLDGLAFICLLGRFNLLKWRKEIPVETREASFRQIYSFRLFRSIIEINETGKVIILRMSPAQLINMRREKEKLYNLPRLEVTTDNYDIVAGKGRVPHYAEEYQ